MEVITNISELSEEISSNKKYLLVLNDNLNIDIKISSDSFLNLQIVILDSNNKNIEITGRIDLEERGNLEVDIVDFSSKDTSLSINGNLASFSSANYQIGVVAYLSSQKVYDVKLNAIGENTTSLVKMNGVSLDKAYLKLLGSTDMIKGCKKSVARQEGRIANLSKLAKAQVSPMLNIYENDIKASHGGALGQVSMDVLYYLMSRGLTRKQAVSIIVIGYLKPFIYKIDNVDIQNQLLAFINKRGG